MGLLSVLSSLLSAQHAVCLSIAGCPYSSGQRQCAHQAFCTTFHPQRQMLMQHLFSHGITSSQMSLPFAPLGAESWSKTQIHQANSLYAPEMEYVGMTGHSSLDIFGNTHREWLVQLTTTINISFGNIWISFGIIWNHLVNIWTHLVNIWTMDFAQMMTLLIVSQRHFMHGPSNVYRVIWDCIGVILTPCCLFYLTDICQTLIDKFDRCQGPKTVQKSRCAGPRAAQRLFNVLPLFLLYCVLNKHHIVPLICVHYSLPCLSYSDSNRGKGVMEVSAFALGETLGHQAGFVPGDLSIVPLLDAEDPFAPYGLSAFGELCQLESLELGEGCHFVVHGLEPLNALWGLSGLLVGCRLHNSVLGGWMGGKLTVCSGECS